MKNRNGSRNQLVSPREGLLEKTEDLGYVQLHVFQVKQVLVITLLWSIISTRGLRSGEVLFTNLLEQVVNLQVHLQNCLVSTLVVESNDEGTRCR